MRRGLVPVTLGLVVAGGTVMARTADASWQAVAVMAAAILMLATRMNPLLILFAGGALGGLGLL